MSHIFDTLRRVESERNGLDPRVPSDTVELLGLVGRRFALDPEPAVRASFEPANRPLVPQEQRLRVVGSPLSVGGRTPASFPAPIVEPSASPALEVLPDPPSPVPASTELPSTHETISSVPPPVDIRQEAALLDVRPVVDPPFEVPVPVSRFDEAEVYVGPTFAAPIEEVPTPEAPAPVVPAIAAQTPEAPDYEPPLQIAPPPVQKEQKELVAANPAEEFQFRLPPRLQRAVSAVRTALPLVARILPLFEGNFGAAVNNLLAPVNPEPTTPPPSVEIELTPIQNGMAELKTLQRELGDQVVEHGQSIKRIDDQLEMVRMSTDRNTLEQQELIEELKEVGKKVNVVVVIGLLLLAVSVALNTALYLHIVKVIR